METKIAATTLSTNSGDEEIKSEVSYYLLQNINRREELGVSLLYGVKVVLANSGRVIDSAEVSDVTSLKNKCVALIELLAKNTVTPATLADVVYDLSADGLATLREDEDFGCAAALAEIA